MSDRPVFDFDVSVTADKRRRMRRRGFAGEFEDSRRGCEWPGCDRKGDHRAPRSPDELNRYRWFCIDHIREYNRRWDYYSGMSPEEIERAREADRIWDRPTWRMRGVRPQGATAHPHAEGRAWERNGLQDPHDVLGENATINPGDTAVRERRRARRRLLSKGDARALKVLDLDELATYDDVRERYKALVKELHPDMNGGDRGEEERLRQVITAWTHLKQSAAFRR